MRARLGAVAVDGVDQDRADVGTEVDRRALVEPVARRRRVARSRVGGDVDRVERELVGEQRGDRLLGVDSLAAVAAVGVQARDQPVAGGEGVDRVGWAGPRPARARRGCRPAGTTAPSALRPGTALGLLRARRGGRGRRGRGGSRRGRRSRRPARRRSPAPLSGSTRPPSSVSSAIVELVALRVVGDVAGDEDGLRLLPVERADGGVERLCGERLLRAEGRRERGADAVQERHPRGRLLVADVGVGQLPERRERPAELGLLAAVGQRLAGPGLEEAVAVGVDERGFERRAGCGRGARESSPPQAAKRNAAAASRAAATAQRARRARPPRSTSARPTGARHPGPRNR